MTSPLYGLPELTGTTVERTATNLNFRYIESLFGSVPTEVNVSTVPTAPTDGSVYLISGTPTGIWSGKSGQVGVYTSSGWFYTNKHPQYTFDSGVWTINASGGSGLGSVTLTGTPNAGQTVKATSPTTASWQDVRVTLTANRTYFVRTDGTRTGALAVETDATTNTATDAFGSITTALTAMTKFDANGFTPTLQVQSGTYTITVVSLPSIVGADNANLILAAGVIVQSNTSDPSAFGGVIETRQSVTSWEVSGSGTVQVTSGSISRACLFAYKGLLKYTNITFGLGSANFGHIWAPEGGLITCTGNYTISDGAGIHFYGNAGGTIRCQSKTLTIIGTPSFSRAFAIADFGGQVVANDCSFTSSATGKRYQADSFGKIIGLGGANYFPGDITGTPVPSPSESQVHTATYGYYF